jgi:hypothetical protein
MTKEVVVRVYPPTAGVGVLYINGGGARGVIPLKFIQRIQDYIRLPIPLQRFFKVTIRTSSGKCYKETLSFSNSLRGLKRR